MPEQKQAPRPHGDPLEREIVEDNPAQRQSDAPGDVVAADRPEAFREETDRSGGKGSTANGIPAADEDDGAARRKAHDAGAELVSKID
jgi:hypothetical protein